MTKPDVDALALEARVKAAAEAQLAHAQKRRLDAQRRLASVDKRYREYAAGAKPT